jgi:DNA end-binding protein Ku
MWTGTIGFGLVNVPVRLYPATKRKDVRFHELDRLTGRRIHHQRVVEEAPSATLPRERASEIDEMLQTPSPALPARGREEMRMVQTPEVLKGFEVAKDRYVTVEHEELEELAPERSRSIDVEQFVPQDAVDPIYLDTSYYVVPERDHERAFGLLVETMSETKQVAIAWFVLRRKRYLAALRPYGRLMVLSTMFHADEVLPASELEPGTPTDLRKKEREMAALLVNTLSGPFEPERYPDEYRKRLSALIEGRAASAQALPSTEVLTGSGVQDLMAALQASVEQARAARNRKPSAAQGKPMRRNKRKTA